MKPNPTQIRVMVKKSKNLKLGIGSHKNQPYFDVNQPDVCMYQSVIYMQRFAPRNNNIPTTTYMYRLRRFGLFYVSFRIYIGCNTQGVCGEFGCIDIKIV